MKLSYLWLNEFVDLSDFSPFELANLLTMKTCEVETVEKAFPYLENFPVALVEEVENHPNANKLKICKVNTGKKKFTVITGAANVKKGKKYPLAEEGVTLPTGKKIEKALLRGVESEGMLCSSQELLLDDFIWQDPESLTGVLELDDNFPLGENIKKILFGDDYIIEIDNKSITHRPDLWSHFGFAREISALLNRKLKKDPLNYSFPEIQREEKKEILIEEGTLAYYGLCFFAKKRRTTPLAIQAKLIVCGMRPINFWVDVSNYVMLEIGQPTHAFSLAKLKDQIVVNYAQDGEEIKLLDGKTLKLKKNILLIRDGKKPVALAGVMGGIDTETNEEDEAIFLESATFLRKDIRHTVSTLQLRTEASQRFEKGLSPLLAKAAVTRYFHILNSFCQVEIGPVVFWEKESPKKNKITSKLSYIKERLGLENLKAEQIQEILSRLHLEVSLKGDELEVVVPDFRSYYDITIPEDLVEEVGRVIGYKEITPIPFLVPCSVPPKKDNFRKLEHFLRNLFAFRYHFTEVYNYHFCTEEELLLDDRYSENAITLLNPLQQDQKYLRRSPLVMLLRNVKEYMKEYPQLRFFEIERIFLPKKTLELPQEKLFLSAIEVDTRNPVENLRKLLCLCGDLLKELGYPLEEVEQIPLKEKVFHPSRGVSFYYQNQVLLRAGQIHPAITDKLKIAKPLFYLELFLEDVVGQFTKKTISYKSPPKYPRSDFEITVVAPKKTPLKEILKVAGKKETPPEEDRVYIEEVSFLGIYEGPQIGEGKKAVSLRVSWRNPLRTLKPEEIKALQDQLVEKMASSGFFLRQ